MTLKTAVTAAENSALPSKKELHVKMYMNKYVSNLMIISSSMI